MTVEQGAIYALLGASGCGKTTLLSTIVGLKNLNRGEIRIFGHRPKSKGSQIPGKGVGYQPQEIALFDEFTIGEAFNFFGTIYGMPKLSIKSRMDFIIKLLDLPPYDRIVRSLSGGQKRRVSFAVALLHEPRLLVLDEPTVGIDPLLRECIWLHLKELAANGITIVITTHNIDEAMNSTHVGLMRGGKLLTEKQPQELIETYGCSLEEVVLRLCLRDEAKSKKDLAEVQVDGNSDLQMEIPEHKPNHLALTFSGPNFYKDIKEWNKDFLKEFYNRLSALLVRNFIRMWRNIGFLIFLSLFPALGLIMFCYAVGGQIRDLDLGFINKEQNFGSCFENQHSSYEAAGCNLETNLSCRFLNTIPYETINLIEYQNETQAIEDVLKGKTWGYLIFPATFEWITIFQPQNQAQNHPEDTKIQVRIDMSNQQVALIIQNIIGESFQTFTKQIFESCSENPLQGHSKDSTTPSPIYFGKPFFGDKQATFTEYIAPSLFIAQLLFMSVSLTGQVLIDEKHQGMFERVLVAGVSKFEVILSHLIPQCVIMLGQTFTSLFILIVWFDITVRGSLGEVIFISILQGSIGILIGFLISTICSKESTAMQLTLGLITPNFVLSGVMWPIQGMPKWMRAISFMLPGTYASESIRSMLARGWSMTHPKVIPGFMVSFVWIYFLSFIVIFINRSVP